MRSSRQSHPRVGLDVESLSDIYGLRCVNRCFVSCSFRRRSFALTVFFRASESSPCSNIYAVITRWRVSHEYVCEGRPIHPIDGRNQLAPADRSQTSNYRSRLTIDLTIDLRTIDLISISDIQHLSHTSRCSADQQSSFVANASPN